MWARVVKDLLWFGVRQMLKRLLCFFDKFLCPFKLRPDVVFSDLNKVAIVRFFPKIFGLGKIFPDLLREEAGFDNMLVE